MDDNIFSKSETSEDRGNILRPDNFSEYTGQKKIIDNLKIYIKSAKERNDSLDHCLFYGPPGLGKTTLAEIVAKELNVNLKRTSGPTIEKSGDLAAHLTNLSQKEVLFIDEIHRLNPAIEEILYPAMEDFKLDLLIGQGPAARTVRLDIPHFTLIGATTRAGLLTSPLMERFGIVERLEFYNHEELASIIIRGASILNVKIEDEAALEIAKRSRGTPRIAHRILSRMRDFAYVLNKDKIITLEVAKEGLQRLEIDEEGLNSNDRRYLDAIIKKYDGGPVGLDTIAAVMSEEKDTIEDVIESYLIYRGFIKKTPRGRAATPIAYDHLKIKRSLTLEEFFE